MKTIKLTIYENIALCENFYRMVLTGNDTPVGRPGQFVGIQIPGFFLRRPISICDTDDHSLTIIYKTVGDGTEAMAKMAVGEKVDVLTELGHGYGLDQTGEKPLLIGGGVGVPPMYYLAKELIKQGKQISVIMGFNTKQEIFYKEAFEALGCKVTITTVDGSEGIKGFVTNAMDQSYTGICACGPLPMLRAVNQAARTDGQYSFEERMGCGVGACMGCVMKDKDGNSLRVCKEGPVLTLAKEVL